jgi:hypothetical protein
MIVMIICGFVLAIFYIIFVVAITLKDDDEYFKEREKVIQDFQVGSYVVDIQTNFKGKIIDIDTDNRNASGGAYIPYIVVLSADGIKKRYSMGRNLKKEDR